MPVNFRLLLIILLEGFVTVSVQVLALRQLAPFVGNSVIVTSLIIGVFLLFLAIGYRRGGQYQADYLSILKTNFSIAAIFIGIGLSYYFCLFFFYSLESFVSKHVLFNLTLYLLLVIAPIVYILGQTIPITTNLFRQQQHIGSISGTALYLSTIGSFLGAVLTSLVLMNYLGVAWSVVINYIILLILIVLLIPAWRKEGVRLILLGAGFYLVFVLNIGFERNNFVRTNQYANYQVEAPFLINNAKTVRAFIVNNSLSSYIDTNQRSAPYIEKIKHYLFEDLGLRQKTVLVIGAGAFSLSAQGVYDNDFTYVDIDSDIKAITLAYFMPEIKGQFIAADARVYFQQNQLQYDVIVSDAYNQRTAIPYYLLTEEYFKKLRQALKPGGIAVFNLIMRPMLNDAYSKRLDNTLSSVFPNCMKVPLRYLDAPANVLYFCKISAQEADSTRYSDNLNRSTLDYFKSTQ